MPATSKSFFTANLLAWYRPTDRPMPWKEEKDAYKVWLSEIILQQTRVEQGLPYYLKFTEAFPTVQHLALAPADQVMKLWQGLGYYSRARNLHAAAQYIHGELGGIFPNNYEALLKLKGVGDYTAAAIASFVFNEPRAVLDGNVYRVLARYFGIETPIDSPAAKKQFSQLANELIPAAQAGLYNQAIMDFGATVCKPALPLCTTCPLAANCVALKEGIQDQLPIKASKIKQRERFFHYIILNADGDTLIEHRTGKDIWQELYQFPMLEAASLLTPDAGEVAAFVNKLGIGDWQITAAKGPYTQKLTHQKINAWFIEVTVNEKLNMADTSYKLIEREILNNFAFPKIIDCYLRDNRLYLSLS
ncbi:A/G-specific adenine glycosylase [soil metagenome]